MKAIINFSKRTNWFKVSMALITCLLFLIPPACEKLEPNQDSILGTDEMVATPRAASTATKMFWGPRECGGGGNWEDWICPPWYENFGNFVLKVQNLSEVGAKISTLEIRISDVLILTAKGLSKDYFATKALRSLSNCAKIYIVMEGDQGSKIRVWVEATFKGLGTAYGKHLYYKSVQQIGNFNPDNFTSDINRFDMAREYCQWAGGHLLIISSAKENAFVQSICNNGQYLIGLSDYQRESEWRWVDWNLCRVVIWNFTQCPNPNYPLNYGDRNCTVIQDYGYNNWGNNQPDNCDGWNCSNAENVAVINNDGTWDDRNLDQINWISFVMEWDFIPNSTVIRDLFMREYPDYQYPW